MSKAMGAIGGLGTGMVLAAQQAGRQEEVDKKLQADKDMAALTNELAMNREKALLAIRSQAGDAARTKMTGAIKEGAAGIVDGQMAGNQVADPSTWTPEQEAARNAGMANMAQNPATQARAAAQAGYIDEAAKLDKIAEGGASTVPFGAARIGADGTVIYDGGTEYKRSLEQQRADAATTRAENAGNPKGAKGTKADHFEEKQWDAAFKPDKGIVAMPSPMGDKDVDSAALRGFYKTAFNYARNTGDYSPNEANEMASTTVIKMRDKALARSQASGGKLTPEQAASQILSEYRAAAEKSQPSANRGGSEGQTVRRAADGEMGADAASLQREISQAKADLNKVTDEPSKAALRQQIADLEGDLVKVQAGRSANASPKPAAAPAPKADDKAPAPKPAEKEAPLEWEALRQQAKGLDSQIADARRDYNMATSVRGGKGVTDETKAKIKAKLDTLIAQQRELYSKSDEAYRAADKSIINSRVAPGQNLNAKYQ